MRNQPALPLSILALTLSLTAAVLSAASLVGSVAQRVHVIGIFAEGFAAGAAVAVLAMSLRARRRPEGGTQA